MKLWPWICRAILFPTRQPPSVLAARNRLRKTLGELREQCETRKLEIASHRDKDQCQVRIGN